MIRKKKVKYRYERIELSLSFCLCNSCKVYNLCLAGYKVECMGFCGCSINWPVGGVASRDAAEAGTASISQKKSSLTTRKCVKAWQPSVWCLYCAWMLMQSLIERYRHHSLCRRYNEPLCMCGMCRIDPFRVFVWNAKLLCSLYWLSLSGEYVNVITVCKARYDIFKCWLKLVLYTSIRLDQEAILGPFLLIRRASRQDLPCPWPVRHYSRCQRPSLSSHHHLPAVAAVVLSPFLLPLPLPRLVSNQQLTSALFIFACFVQVKRPFVLGLHAPKLRLRPATVFCFPYKQKRGII